MKNPLSALLKPEELPTTNPATDVKPWELYRPSCTLKARSMMLAFAAGNPLSVRAAAQERYDAMIAAIDTEQAATHEQARLERLLREQATNAQACAAADKQIADHEETQRVQTAAAAEGFSAKVAELGRRIAEIRQSRPGDISALISAARAAAKKSRAAIAKRKKSQLLANVNEEIEPLLAAIEQKLANELQPLGVILGLKERLHRMVTFSVYQYSQEAAPDLAIDLRGECDYAIAGHEQTLGELAEMQRETAAVESNPGSSTGLGECNECHGPLCVVSSGWPNTTVSCEKCGKEVPDHPYLTAAK